MPLPPGGAALSIAGEVREFAVATPEAVAVADGDRRLTYRALDDRSSRLANVLLDAGLRPGERVAVLLGNRLEYPEVACGIAKAGVPATPCSTATEAAYVLGHSESRALIQAGELSGLTDGQAPKTVLTIGRRKIGSAGQPCRAEPEAGHDRSMIDITSAEQEWNPWSSNACSVPSAWAPPPWTPSSTHRAYNPAGC
ncbi:AMP-binding protein [Nonomuraea sp. NPDC048916]|uniref:AMP-binding protein n=1 Tax=Nonomuraea sp. NPDC048916 TaxID=3154232 RepID=UPI0033F3CDEB